MSVFSRRSRRAVGTRAILALGANIGDRDGNIGAAIADIDALRDVHVEAVSPLYETPALRPDGVDVRAPAYLNAVIAVRTELPPTALLNALQLIERGHGRIREARWADRTLDIDIITFDDLQSEDVTLTLPHPRAAERAFVLAPWLDIEPDAVLTGRGRVSELRALVHDEVRPFHLGDVS